MKYIYSLYKNLFELTYPPKTGNTQKSLLFYQLQSADMLPGINTDYYCHILQLFNSVEKIDVEEIRNNNETENKKDELNVKTKIDKELKYDRWIKVGCETAKVIVPIIFYAKWMDKGFEFEKTGTFTSNTFRNLFGRFKPE